MLTPSFELSQDETFLTILIKARYAKVSEAEIYVDGTDFKFYSKPYFLRLTLPGCVIEDGRGTAKYDIDKGYFTIILPKEIAGEHFEGLDMLTKLLAPAGKVSAKEPSVEVIAAGSEPAITGEFDKEVGEDEVKEDVEEEDVDWQVLQQPFEDDEMSMGGSTYYGFANRRTGVFARLQDELCGIVDVPEPDQKSLLVRREARQQAEQLKFDEDHYIADFLEDDCIQSVLEYKTPWYEQYQRLKKKQADEVEEDVAETDSIVILTEEERDQMIKLPKKQYLLDQKTEASVLLGLVDIMFAYSYDVRTTEGEHSVESAWTICKLSSTLSWLEFFTSLDDVVNVCFTRALSYPLYRHWQLNLAVLKDVTMIFHLGRKQLLKCLLDIYRILSRDEPHYILNDLYITDYCVWIQSVSQSKIHSLAQALEKVDMNKTQMSLDLVELEQTALMMKDEDAGEDESYDDENDNDDSHSSSEDSSDDESAEEGDDESEEIANKRHDVGRVRNKKRLDGSHQQPSRLIYQYGYPNVLSSGQQNYDSASNDEELVVGEGDGGEETFKQIPLTSLCRAQKGSSPEEFQQNRTMAETGLRYEEDIDKGDGDWLEDAPIGVMHIDEISAEVYKLALENSEEEPASTYPSSDLVSTEPGGPPMDDGSSCFTDGHGVSGVVLAGGKSEAVKNKVALDDKIILDIPEEELYSDPLSHDAGSTTQPSDKIALSSSDQDQGEAILLEMGNGTENSVVYVHDTCCDMSANQQTPGNNERLTLTESPATILERVGLDGNKEHVIDDQDCFTSWVKTPPNQKIEMFEEM